LFFGNTELVGHLPIYGAMLVLLVYGSDPQLRPTVSLLWPWSRRSALRDITDPEGHDPLTTNRPAGANLMA